MPPPLLPQEQQAPPPQQGDLAEIIALLRANPSLVGTIGPETRARLEADPEGRALVSGGAEIGAPGLPPGPEEGQPTNRPPPSGPPALQERAPFNQEFLEELPLDVMFSGLKDFGARAITDPAGLRHGVSGAIREAGDFLMDLPVNLVRGMAQESGEAMGEVNAMFDSGPPALRGLGGPVASMAGFPLVGPFALRTMQRAGEDHPVQRVAGGAAGFGLPFATPAPQAVRASKPTGLVRRSLSQRMKPGMLQAGVEFAETVSSRTIGGMNTARQHLAWQQDDLVKNVITPTVDNIAATKGINVVKRAEVVGELLNEGRAAFNARSGAIFDLLRKRYEDFAFVDIREAQQIAREQAALLRKRSKTLDSQALTELDAFAELDAVVDLDTALLRRNALGDLAWKGTERPTGTAQAGLAKVQDALRANTKASLMEVGGPNAAGLYERGMQMRADLHAAFNGRISKQLLDASPEVLPELLRRVTIKEIEEMRRILPPGTMDEMGALFVADIFFGRGAGQAITGELSERAAMAGQPGGAEMFTSLRRPPFAQEVVSGRKTRRLKEAAGTEKIDALAGTGTAAKLDDIADTARVVGLEDPRRLNGGILSGIMNATVVGGFLGAASSPLRGFSGIGASLTTGGTIVGGAYLAAKLTMSPQGFTTLRKWVIAAGRFGENSLPAQLAAREMAKHIRQEDLDRALELAAGAGREDEDEQQPQQ